MDKGEFAQYKADHKELSDKIGNLEIGFARIDERFKNLDEKLDRFLRGIQTEFVTMSRFNSLVEQYESHLKEMMPLKQAYDDFQKRLLGYATTAIIIAVSISGLLVPWVKAYLIK